MSDKDPKIVRTTREIIDGVLLDALESNDMVAVLATKKDLDLFISAFEAALLFSPYGEVPDKWRELSTGLMRLRKEAFRK